MRLRGILIAAAAAGALGIAAPAITAAPAHASGITECGGYNMNNAHHMYWTFGRFSGFSFVWHLTTRNVPCYLARSFALHVSRTGDYRYHGFRYRVRWYYDEDYDIRATKGDQVIDWQGGA